MLTDIRKRLENMFSDYKTPPPSTPIDLKVVDREFVIRDGYLDHIWYETVEEEFGRSYHQHKVIKLAMLRYLPREIREQATLVEKMRKVLRGLYNAQVHLVVLTAGIFDPPLGVVQCYGVQAIADSRETALAEATAGFVALQAALSNFEQSRLELLDIEKSEWLRRAFRMPHALTVIGHPDPRETARGMSGRDRDNPLSPSTANVFGVQQNEYLFRGMAKTQQEFLNVVLAIPVAGEEIIAIHARVAREASRWASLQTGSKSISVGLSIPVIFSGLSSDGAGTSYGTNEARGVSDSEGESHGTTHTEGYARSEMDGVAHTEGHAEGVARTEGSSESVATSRTITEGHTDGEFSSRGVTVGTADTTGHADTVGQADTVGHADTRGSATTTTTSVAQSQGQSHSASIGRSVGFSGNVGGDVGVGIPGVAALGGRAGVGSNVEVSDGESVGLSWGTTTTTTSATQHSQAHTDSYAHTESRAHTESQAHTDSRAVSDAQGTSQADSQAVSTGVTRSVGTFESTTRSQVRSWADTRSHAEGHTWSQADTVSDAVSKAHAVSRALGVAQARSLVMSRGLGVAIGISPSLSASKSFQWEDREAQWVTRVLTQQEMLLEMAEKEGGFLVDNYFLVKTEEGKQALETLVPQAFHGLEDVVTPVRTRSLTPPEEEYIRLHAQTFTPSTRRERARGVFDGYRDSSLLTTVQATAYTAPGLFEEGPAITVQERTPPFAFYPDLKGEMVLGNLFSVERNELTGALLRMGRNDVANTAICADTGFGKSVMAERSAKEECCELHFRVIVLDFGAGWRRMMNIIPAQRFELYGLYPGAPRPIRWNPLQIGRRIPPDRQLFATCELFVNAGRMGERQHGFLRRILRELYTGNGVLIADRDVLADERWGFVEGAELRRLNEERDRREFPPRGRTHLSDLEPWEQQMVAVERSKTVDVTMWYERLKEVYDRLPARDVTNRTSLDGVLLRIEPLTEGELGTMYARGEGSIAIEDLALPWGMAVLEAGEMDEYSKAVMLALIGWHLYTDAVRRRTEYIGRQDLNCPMRLIFEEANKVIGGIESGGDHSERPYVSSIFPTMFRDARKYRIYLTAICQSPSDLLPGILSSCNNLLVGQLKNPRDAEVILPAIARSAHGFQDVDYLHSLSRIPQRLFIARLGQQTDVARIEPMLFEPCMVQAIEPTDADIREYHRFFKHSWLATESHRKFCENLCASVAN